MSRGPPLLQIVAVFLPDHWFPPKFPEMFQDERPERTVRIELNSPSMPFRGALNQAQQGITFAIGAATAA
jgi:hypothetical protein